MNAITRNLADPRFVPWQPGHAHYRKYDADSQPFIFTNGISSCIVIGMVRSDDRGIISFAMYHSVSEHADLAHGERASKISRSIAQFIEESKPDDTIIFIIHTNTNMTVASTFDVDVIKKFANNVGAHLNHPITLRFEESHGGDNFFLFSSGAHVGLDYGDVENTECIAKNILNRIDEDAKSKFEADSKFAMTIHECVEHAKDTNHYVTGFNDLMHYLNDFYPRRFLSHSKKESQFAKKHLACLGSLDRYMAIVIADRNALAALKATRK